MDVERTHAKVQSGRFPPLEARELGRLPTLEQRLPQILAIAFVMLLLVQLALRG